MQTRQLFKLALIPAVAIAMGLPAMAQTEKAATPDVIPMGNGKIAKEAAPVKKSAMKSMKKMGNYHAVRGSKIIGEAIHGSDDKKLGQVEDFIVDMSNGNVRYAVVAFDPGMFSAEKLYAVPMSQLKMTAGKDYFTYPKLSKEKLKNAGFDKAEWKGTVNDREMMGRFDRQWGIPASGNNVKDKDNTLARFAASDLIGKNIKSREDKGIGEIKDLVVDVSAGKVSYAVLGFDPSIFAGEKLFAFSLNSFKRGKDAGDLMLDVDKSKLEAMKNFDESRWERLNDPDRNDYVNSTSQKYGTKKKQ